MGNFLKFLLENKNDEIENNENESNFINESDPSTDPHEIMTACFCAMSDGEFKDSNPNNKTEIELNKIINKIHTIAQTEKIVGQNDKEINSIIEYNDKYKALAQAYSAAILIREQTKIWLKIDEYKCNKVFLTGRTWKNTEISDLGNVKKLKSLGVDTRGMKNFNSSDIVLKIRNKSYNYFYGISLKKSNNDRKDQTLINNSFFKAIKNLRPSNDTDKENFETISNEIQKTFNKSIENIITSDEFKEYVKSNFNNVYNSIEQLNWDWKQDWKQILKNLSNGDNSKIKNPKNRNDIRSHIKEQIFKLDGENSVTNKIVNLINNNEFSKSIAVYLMNVVYKGSLKQLIKNKFNFALCFGVGLYNKNNKTCKVSSGQFYPIEMVETTLTKLKDPILKLNKGKEEKNTKTSLFFDLILKNPDNDNKEIKIAVIELRYKESLTKSPQFLAYMTEEFKELLGKN